MHCTLAFLLLTKSGLQDNSLLALVNNYAQDSHYNVYGIDLVKKFPVPNDGSNIFMTKTVYNGDGTYIATYCSESASGDEIVREISHGLEGKSTGHQAINTDGDRGQIILSRTVADYEVSLAWVGEELKVFCRKQSQMPWLSLSDVIPKITIGGLIHQVAWYNLGPFASVKNLLDNYKHTATHSRGFTGLQQLGRSTSNNERFLGSKIKALTLPRLAHTPELFKYDNMDNFVDDFLRNLFPTKL